MYLYNLIWAVISWRLDGRNFELIVQYIYSKILNSNMEKKSFQIPE